MTRSRVSLMLALGCKDPPRDVAAKTRTSERKTMMQGDGALTLSGVLIAMLPPRVEMAFTIRRIYLFQKHAGPESEFE